MKTQPSPVILEYFAAVNERRLDAAAACFADDAVVHDENRDHAGSQAIRDWIEETTTNYQPTTDVLEVEAQDGTTRVTGRVSGTFPGSPAELKFAFTVNADKITHLSIG